MFLRLNKNGEKDMLGKKVYISGKVRGVEKRKVEASFSAAEVQLESAGYEVVNPLRLVEDMPDSDKTSETAVMLSLLHALSECDCIFMVDGWRADSEGARCEYHFARSCGIKVLNEPPSLLEETIALLYAPIGSMEFKSYKTAADLAFELDESVPGVLPQDIAAILRKKGYRTQVLNGTVCWIVYEQAVFD